MCLELQVAFSFYTNSTLTFPDMWISLSLTPMRGQSGVTELKVQLPLLRVPSEARVTNNMITRIHSYVGNKKWIAVVGVPSAARVTNNMFLLTP